MEVVKTGKEEEEEEERNKKISHLTTIIPTAVKRHMSTT